MIAAEEAATEEAANTIKKGGETAEELAKKAKLKKIKPGEDIDYTSENIAFRPTKSGRYIGKE